MLYLSTHTKVMDDWRRGLHVQEARPAPGCCTETEEASKTA